MTFRESVYKIVKRIPRGMVATYGDIAALAGAPRAARQVGFALRTLGLDEPKVPWWRVVNKKGYISIDHGDAGMEKIIQKDNLLAEGVEFIDEFTVDMEKYHWQR
jgi:methylated-DNA-protein-cysteine methyltransferase-like protein